MKAYATAEWVSGTYRHWRLTIHECPYCGQTHVHGGGTGLKPNYGHRSVHCRAEDVAKRHTGAFDLGGGYELVPG